ncbi:hypothetical protein ABZW30_11080 [Kitasatospora sp. NPDC004669]|uniref:hypothetical protein n=1 Tax=Kitasatospora sp. NPDC004669 TaxID=3154555 RepID=UPI00339EE32D
MGANRSSLFYHRDCALAGGTLGQLLGARDAMWVGAVGELLAVLPILLSPLRAMDRLPTTAVDEERAAAAVV